MEYLRKYAFINLKKRVTNRSYFDRFDNSNGSIKETWNLTDLSDNRIGYM